MTVIIGISCVDGVVIGSDSAMAAGRAGNYTIEWQESGAFKIEVIDSNIITAVTGAFGLGQRFNEQLSETMNFLRRPLQPPQANSGMPSPIQQILFGKLPFGAVPYDVISEVEIGRIVSQLTIMDFQRTASTLQTGTPAGWGLGALFAFVHRNKPYLIDFDAARFHPEIKGMPDPLRGDQDRVWRCVSMGAGQQLADAFLAHAYSALFDPEAPPRVDRAKLAVVWTIDHVKRFNLGLVGGQTRLAVLENVGGEWCAHHEDAGQAMQQVAELKKYIRDFRYEASTISEIEENPLAEL